MKKLLIVCVLLLLCAANPAFASENFGLSASFDIVDVLAFAVHGLLHGEYNDDHICGDDCAEYEFFTGVRLDANYLFLNSPRKALRGGLGVSYWFSPAFWDPPYGPDIEVSGILSTYATVHIYPLGNRDVAVNYYLKGNLGWSTPYGNFIEEVRRGTYFCIGVGVDIEKSFFAELAYSSYSWTTGNTAMRGGQLGLTFGFRF
jgi:hypothetical protein